MLAARTWQRKYTPDDGDLVRLFYVPALEDAKSYDRLTGYFNAGALALAARGIEGLVRNGGHMRLVVGCTLAPDEIEAIEKGAKRHLDVVGEAGDASSGEGAGDLSAALFRVLDEDVSDDETSEEAREADEVALLEQRALAVEEAADIRTLLDGIGVLPPDSKLRELKNVIRELRQGGFARAMVFTQYTDTMGFLRDELGRQDFLADGDEQMRMDESGGGVAEVSRRAVRPQGALRLMCFSGRGGEIRSSGGGAWRMAVRTSNGTASVLPNSATASSARRTRHRSCRAAGCA